MSLIPEMGNALLATGGVLGVCYVILLFADQVARIIKRVF